MRSLAFLVIAGLMLLALPTSLACGGSGDGEGADDCHDYWLHVGDRATGLHANEKGQFQLDVLGAYYVEQDMAYLEGDLTYAYSIWFYSETNDRPGLQRADEVCNNTPEGEDSDAVVC